MFGDDLNRMFSLGNEIKNSIQDIPGIADLNVEQQIERPQAHHLAQAGSTCQIRHLIAGVFGIRQCVPCRRIRIPSVREKERAFDLTVRVKDDLRDEMEKDTQLND